MTRLECLADVKPEMRRQGRTPDFWEKRHRMVSQPTAVQMNARLLAIRQIAYVC